MSLRFLTKDPSLSALFLQSYTLQYSSDTLNWISVYPSLLGTGATIQWIDDGPPKTESLPSTEGTRFYRVISGR